MMGDEFTTGGRFARCLAASRFDGRTYERDLDQRRLTGQAERVFRLIGDGAWRTLAEIHAATGDPEAAISARLRDFRKLRFGAHTIVGRRRGDMARGVWEYRMVTT